MNITLLTSNFTLKKYFQHSLFKIRIMLKYLIQNFQIKK